jgi:hypothetical protein
MYFETGGYIPVLPNQINDISLQSMIHKGRHSDEERSGFQLHSDKVDVLLV